MTQSLDSLLMGYQHLRHIGESILLAGLVGELLVSAFLHERRRAERVGTVVCTAAIIAGVWIENVAGGRADEVIEKMRAPRLLSTEQQEKIVLKLKSFPGTPFVLAVNPVPEAINFMGIIGGVLIASGWDLVPLQTRLREGPMDTVSPFHAAIWYRSGLVVGFPEEQRGVLEKAADVLASVLTAEGCIVETGLITDREVLNPGAIHIVIGSK